MQNSSPSGESITSKACLPEPQSLKSERTFDCETQSFGHSLDSIQSTAASNWLQGVRWQWQKPSNKENDSELAEEEGESWEDYHDRASLHIERAFQSGVERIRVKAEDGHPIELFFYDKMQYSPVTGMAQPIRRKGPESVQQKMARQIKSFLRLLTTGHMRHKSFLRYKKNIERSQRRSKKEKPARMKSCKVLVEGPAFMAIQLIVILANTVFLGLNAQYNGSKASSSTKRVFEVFDNCFCGFFVAELMIRFLSMKKQPSIRKMFRRIQTEDSWFMFDLTIILLMVTETWIMPVFEVSGQLSEVSVLRLLRLTRLTRLARVVRLLKFFPEILIMIKGIFGSMRAVLCSFSLLVLMLYVFAIVFKTRAEDTDLEAKFGTVEASMWMLLVHGCFMDVLADTSDLIYSVDPILGFLFLTFLVLSNLMVLNMLIGVICEVANKVGREETERQDAKLLKHDLLEFLDFFDINMDKQINQQEFESLLGNPDVLSMFERHGIDVVTVNDIKDDIFKSKKGLGVNAGSPRGAQDRSLTYDMLIEVMLRLRTHHGGVATMLDVVNLERSFTSQLQQIQESIDQSNRTRWGSTISPVMCKKPTLAAEMSPEQRLHALSEHTQDQMKLLMAKASEEIVKGKNSQGCPGFFKQGKFNNKSLTNGAARPNMTDMDGMDSIPPDRGSKETSDVLEAVFEEIPQLVAEMSAEERLHVVEEQMHEQVRLFVSSAKEELGIISQAGNVQPPKPVQMIRASRTNSRLLNDL